MNLEDLTRKAGVDASAFFTTFHAKEDLKWSAKLVADLPEHVAVTLFGQYCYKRRALNNGRSPNIWLRKRVATITEMVGQFPIPVIHINTEDRRQGIATEWADRCATVLNNMTDFGNKQVDALELLLAIKEPADQWGFCPVLPDLEGYNIKKALGVFDESPTMYNMIAGAIARLTDENWWQRKLNKAYSQYEEHIAIVVGKVRSGVSPYVSNHAFKQWKQRKEAARLWLNEMQVVNDEHGLELSLADAADASVANPEVRRAELMVRMRGFEDLAIEQGFVGEFYTWTSPSRFHSWVKSKKGPAYSNKKYDGATPKQTQAYLCNQWAKCRAKFAREKIEVFGFRVVEPHHDGTPHWHLLLFFKPEQVELARSIIRHYALQHDLDDFGPQEHDIQNDHKRYKARFDFETIDPERGSATGYLAKYIAKNIDGHMVDDDHEAETNGKNGAQNAAAWSSTWHIRQFQQIGGPSVTVWRELRRLREAIDFDDVVEQARAAADCGNWSRYVDAMGGTFCKRADRPVQLAKAIQDTTNAYGEEVSKIMGVMSQQNHTTINTRLDGWEIRKPQADKYVPSADERAFDVAFDLASKSGDSRAPWSSDNNCTDSIKTPNSDRILITEGKKLGLDNHDLKRLRAGSIINSVVNGRDQYIYIRQGMLLVSRRPPNAHQAHSDWDDPALNSQFDAFTRASTKANKQVLNAQAWRVVDGQLDVDQWLQDMSIDMAKLALEQLQHVVDLQRQEKYAAPYVFKPVEVNAEFDETEDDDAYF
ncbi:replication endonuclease [Shewanella subflava]|uniref:Replication endonuclease n=1 Tax=Shewanella subflava TaxID=2986476 RepID=A0ABT3I5B5_9GAMM|nr:replication endonuclease [Shewanella subflava]MCW3171235.1 replication endonuclease [Shewanella subflava]